MRNTRQRNLVLDIINNSYNHPTAYEVHQECLKTIPNVSLGTVYRNLNTLVNLGEIQSLEIPNGITRYDKKLCHAHFICTKCDNLYDIKESNITYPNIIDGHIINTCKISYEGTCHDCLEQNNKGEDINGTKRK